MLELSEGSCHEDYESHCGIRYHALPLFLGKFHNGMNHYLLYVVLFALHIRPPPLQLSIGSGFVRSISLDSLTSPSLHAAAV